MLTLDALLSPLPHLLNPLLAALFTTGLLTYITFNPAQTNPRHPTIPSTLNTLLYYTTAWNILAVLLALARTFHTWLSNIEGLERDGLVAIWHEILAEGKVRVKKAERKVVWKEEVVLVTGGMGGLGREIVRVVRERGCRGVAVVDLVGGEGGGSVGERWYECDVGDMGKVEGLRGRVGRDVCVKLFSFFCLLA